VSSSSGSGSSSEKKKIKIKNANPEISDHQTKIKNPGIGSTNQAQFGLDSGYFKEPGSQFPISWKPRFEFQILFPKIRPCLMKSGQTLFF
jgi:hypothetical protein